MMGARSESQLAQAVFRVGLGPYAFRVEEGLSLALERAGDSDGYVTQ